MATMERVGLADRTANLPDELSGAATSSDATGGGAPPGRLSLVNLTPQVAGTVTAVSLAAGDRMSASSDTAVITVPGGDGHVVNLTVPLTSIEALEVGQAATVSVPSAAQPLTGTVSSIGVLDVSETSTPEYEVVVALDPTSEPLFDGSSAQVEIAVAGTGEVRSLPSSPRSSRDTDKSGATERRSVGGGGPMVDVQRG